ncbi:hypothetical protein QFC22_005702 [Naganishia vaughanmartiniae]|uniref:Uncharacterized protein n=1 Tax=Naganishia vaughanmartiniae TaxID=1424756 RepID=A0ACC2WR53_9TREE|nr:hypothetical protein QFC22_005702 [Naganishia vaughanmartiniae]
MEKFSKWRVSTASSPFDPSTTDHIGPQDAGTGIQPFLPPVPAGGKGGPQWAVYNAAATLSAVSRSAALLFLAVAYMVAVQLPKTLLQKVDAQPKQGDLVVCNWTGVVDVLYLAFRFNPTFLLPIHELLPASSATGSGTATPTSNSNLPSISQSAQAKFIGYTPVSLLTILRNTGHTPSAFRSLVTTPQSESVVDLRKVFPSLESVRKVVPGPVVVFPEGTTSNGRALLRFADGVLGDVKSVPTSTAFIIFSDGHPLDSTALLLIWDRAKSASAPLWRSIENIDTAKDEREDLTPPQCTIKRRFPAFGNPRTLLLFLWIRKNQAIAILVDRRGKRTGGMLQDVVVAAWEGEECRVGVGG